jgi:phosphoribosylamine--glycine ligase
MERVGILIVCYGSRGVAMVDAFCRSEKYSAEVYVVDKQRNPFNVDKAKEHVVISDLDVRKICRFAEKYERKIDFGIIGPEKPIINGIREIIEEKTNIPIICPTKEYAIERSKVTQRRLFQEVVPETNPAFKVFDPKDYSSVDHVKRDVYAWLDELNDQVAVKPDSPAAGKGVGVWGDHFSTREQMFEHFLSNYKHGPVIIEEKLEGEESSFQAFCDGKHLVPVPDTRDYKRAFDGDKGPNTGGMGSYKDVGDWPPFMTSSDKMKEIEIVNSIFKKLRGKASNPDLRGMPFYDAFMHTKKGPKILENNSRSGDPEIQNILPILKDDFVDVCFRIIDGNLTQIEIEEKATVVTYKTPPTYGGFKDVFPQRVDWSDVNRPVDLSAAHKLSEKWGDMIRVYPGSMELRDGQTYALKSRTVCVVGIADDIKSARQISLDGVKATKGGSLWYRTDIASKEHIAKSISHMKMLRTLE